MLSTDAPPGWLSWLSGAVAPGMISPALAAKRQDQAARLRKDSEAFMALEMYTEAAGILEVARNLDPSFEFLITEAKAKHAHKQAQRAGVSQPKTHIK